MSKFKHGDFIKVNSRFYGQLKMSSFTIWRVVARKNSDKLYRLQWGQYDTKTNKFEHWEDIELFHPLEISRVDIELDLFVKISSKLKNQLALYLTGI